MQATGVTPPVLNLKSLVPGRAETYPTQDLFQSLLQQRMVSRSSSSGSSSTKGLNRSLLKTQLRQARPADSTSHLAATMQKLSDRVSASKSQKSSDPIPLHLTRKLIDRADKTRNQNQTSSSSSSEPADSSSQSWKADLRARALKLAQGNTQTTAVAVPTSAVEMPQTLKGLIEFINQQPGQALKVPADRLPEVEAFLLQAGLPQEQVKNLVTSPRFQEQGLSATDLVSAWQKAVQDTLQQDLATAGLQQAQVSSKVTPAPLNPLQNLTSQADYQNMWQNLTLPAEALGDLRLELQQMGAPQEALSKLNQQNFPQGIPLTQVWQLIQQASKSPAAALAANAAAESNATQASSPLMSGEKDLEKWRQLLVQSGMDPELAKTLVSASNPTNQEELRTGLLKMAPPSNPISEGEVPQPLYLPESVRVRAVPLLQQQPNSGQGGSGDGGNWDQNFGFSAQAQGVKLPGAPDLNNFLALLTDNSPLKADQAVSTGAAGGPDTSINALLTPEAREALWSQVKNGILSNLRPGENQVTLTLNPPEMGKLNLTLNVKGETVEVIAVTTHSAVAEAATAGVQQLAQALNQQGLILTQFQFHHQDEAAKGQTQFASSQNSGDQRQTGKKDANADRWEQPTTPRRQRWTGGIDCFA